MVEKVEVEVEEEGAEVVAPTPSSLTSQEVPLEAEKEEKPEAPPHMEDMHRSDRKVRKEGVRVEAAVGAAVRRVVTPSSLTSQGVHSEEALVDSSVQASLLAYQEQLPEPSA